MTIALVTDSTADLPEDITKQYDIHVIPNVLVIDGISLEEGIDITRKEFYERLPYYESYPTTSTASPGTYHKIYEKLIQQGAETVLSIHVSKDLSGIYSSACTAARAFGERVRVVNSQQITLGLGFQVLAAAEGIARGLGLDAILNIIDDVRQRALVIAMLDTLEYVALSGRVSWARARIGNLLRIKPFIKVIRGDVLRIGDTRTRTRGIQRLKKMLLDLGPLERVAILHSNAEADAKRIMDELSPDLPPNPLIVNVTTVIGVHIGQNGLGFAAVVEKI